MTLIRLACPECGGSLDATAELTLFACRACGAVSEIGMGPAGSAALVRWHTEAVAARHECDASEIALLPVWVLPVASARTGDDHIAVPALRLGPGSSFLRLARALTLASPHWRRWTGAPRPRCGGLLGAADAAALAETIRLACLPRDLRLAALERNAPAPPLGAPQLHYFPFARHGARLFDMVGGAEISARVLGDIAWHDIAMRSAEARAAPAPGLGDAPDLGGRSGPHATTSAIVAPESGPAVEAVLFDAP